MAMVVVTVLLVVVVMMLVLLVAVSTWKPIPSSPCLRMS